MRLRTWRPAERSSCWRMTPRLRRLLRARQRWRRGCPTRPFTSPERRASAPGLRATYVAAPRCVRSRLFAGLHHAAIKASALDAEILGELVLSGAAESILSAKAAEACRGNQAFDAVFGLPGVDDDVRLFRALPLPGTSGRGPEIERACRAKGVRVLHSDRFAAARG